MKKWNSIVISLMSNRFHTNNDENSRSYRTFGNHDSLVITNVGSDSANGALKEMWSTTYNLSAGISAGESIHNLFATTDFDYTTFWSEKDKSYLFVSFLQLKFEPLNTFDEQVASFKSKLICYLEQSGINKEDYAIYLSLDSGEIVLFVKSGMYEHGAQSILGTKLKLEFPHYCYSVCGIDINTILCRDENINETLTKVVVCAVIDDAEGYSDWYFDFLSAYPEELHCIKHKSLNRACKQCPDSNGCSRNSNEYTHLTRLGNENICINIYNCEITHFVKMLIDVDKGVFCPQNDLVKKALSRFRIHFDTKACDVTIPNKDNVNVKASAHIIDNVSNEDAATLDSAKNSNDIWWSNHLDYKNLMDEPIHKAIFEVLKSFENLEKRDFAFDVQDCIRNVLQLFLKKILQYKNGLTEFTPEEFNKDLIYFTTGILSIANGTLHADKLFVNAPGFNAVVCDAPSKLLLFYTAYVQNLANLLNDHADVNAQYRFLLCPDLYQSIEIHSLFSYRRDPSQLLKVRLPIGSLFNPETLLIELSHEVAHYAGDSIRQRAIRKETLVKILADTISHILLRPIKLEGDRPYAEQEIIEKFVVITESEEISLDAKLIDDWKGVPQYLYKLLDSIMPVATNPEDFLLVNVSKYLQDGIWEIFSEEGSREEIMNTIYDILLTSRGILPDKSSVEEMDDFSSLISMLDHHMLRIVLLDYQPIVEQACELCSEAFSDMVMLYALNDPLAYLKHMFRSASKKVSCISKDWNSIIRIDAMGDRILSALLVNGYKAESNFGIVSANSIQLESGSSIQADEFDKFIKALINYATINDDGTRLFTGTARGYVVEYLDKCISCIKVMPNNNEFFRIRELFQTSQAGTLNMFVSKMQEIAFEFRTDIRKV